MNWRKSRWVCLLFFTLLAIQTTAGLARQTDQLPLAGNGLYKVSIQAHMIVDPNRSDWRFSLLIWYPATEERSVQEIIVTQPGPATAYAITLLKAEPKARSVTLLTLNAGQRLDILEIKNNWTRVKASDQEGWVHSEDVVNVPVAPYVNHAPYPLILFSSGYSKSQWHDDNWLRNLASHGFVVASIRHLCGHEPTCLVDRPLDVISALDQLSKNSSGSLAGVIDTNNVGVMGYAVGGYTALAVTGARINPANLQKIPTMPDSLNISLCWLDASAAAREAVSSYRSVFNPSKGAMWQPITDARIRAVVAVVPVFERVFGDQGLEAATVPTLMMAARNDAIVDYKREIMPSFSHFGAKDSTLISIDSYDHNLVHFPEAAAYIKHFSAAFFEYNLQDHIDAAENFSANYVGQFSDLTWGVSNN
jgi:predicted dienelactone hydrolase